MSENADSKEMKLDSHGSPDYYAFCTYCEVRNRGSSFNYNTMMRKLCGDRCPHFQGCLLELESYK